MRRDGESCDSELEMRRFKEISSTGINTCREGGQSQALSVVPRQDQSDGHRLKYEQFPLNIQEHFFLLKPPGTDGRSSGRQWSLQPGDIVRRCHDTDLYQVL